MGYSPALDGLRALAIMMVMGAHATSFLGGGFLGVDVFFVLSGFLITHVLSAQVRDAGRVQFDVFYARRARRLLPALALVCLLAWCLWGLVPMNTSPFLEAFIPVALYHANIQAMFDVTKLGMLSGAWSLAAEEQFYLVWPIAVPWFVAMSRRSPKVAPAILLSIALVCGFARGTLFLSGSVWGGYFSPLTRLDELCIGGALAFAGTQMSTAVARVLAWVFVFCLPLLTVVTRAEQHWLYLGGLTVFSAGAAGMIACVTSPERGMFKTLFSHPLLVALGKRSYGLYLYHGVLFAWLGTYRVPYDVRSTLLVTGARVLLSFAVTELSYRFIEEPIRRWKREKSSGPDRSDVADPEVRGVAARD